MAVPAILAAAGRLTEARASLLRYGELDAAEGKESHEFERFARRLTHRMDDGGQLPPTGRGDSHEPEPSQPVGAEDALRVARAERDATETVRRCAGGVSRETAGRSPGRADIELAGLGLNGTRNTFSPHGVTDASRISGMSGPPGTTRGGT